MKKLLAIITFLFLIAGFTAACAQNQGDTKAPDTAFSITIEGAQISSADLLSLQYVNVSVTRFGRDGEEQVSCSGYLLKDVLTQAGLDSFEQLTVTAADGFSTTINRETALAETTLLCLEEDQQLLPADSLPMLAVDGAGGNVWVRQIDQITAE